MGRPRGRRQRDARRVDGVLLLDKPEGITSNGALQRVKRLYHARKAGHTGSLDPLASGMLPICFGQATKISAYLLDADKAYTVTAAIGTRTDTADADGEVVERAEVDALERDALEAAMAGFHGEIMQVPPMYSALKQGGKRLYELARDGIEVERQARPVTIHELVLAHYDRHRPVFRVRCSKGTYVRTLIEDIAAAAGTLAHVAALRRDAVYPFAGYPMHTLPALEAAAEAGTTGLDALLLPLDEALGDWPGVTLDPAETFHLLQGNPVQRGAAARPGLVRIYDAGERFLGVGELFDDGRLAPKRLFVGKSGGRSPAAPDRL